MSSESRVLVVLGAGPGLGASVARRFAREGFSAVLVSNEPDQVEEVAENLRAEGVDASTLILDLTNPDAVHQGVSGIGRIDVLHFNPSAFRHVDALHLTVDELFADLSVGVAPVLPALQAARPNMPAGARLLVTGSAAADKPWHEAPSLGMQKAALRNLVTSIDKTLAPDGIRAVAVQVNGVLSREGAFTPDLIADAMYAAVSRPDDGWTPHVPYDG